MTCRTGATGADGPDAPPFSTLPLGVHQAFPTMFALTPRQMQLDSKTISKVNRRPHVYAYLAPIYDALVPVISSRARALGRQWLDVRDGESVLDVGSGTGRALAELAAANPSGWSAGIDATPAMVSRAVDRLRALDHDHWTMEIGCATDLPFRNNRFDAVFSSYLIDVIPSTLQRTVLDEMHRVLRPGGRVLLVYVTTPINLCGRLWRRVSQHVPALLGHARPIEPRPVLVKAGFEVDEFTTRTQSGLRSGIVRAIA